MEDGYISVAEFARRAGVTPQAVYKRLSTDLSTEFKLVDNQKMLKVSALERFGLNQFNNQADKVDNRFNNQVESNNEPKEVQNETIIMLQKTISLLETQAETLQAELAIKNKQIEELNERLKESHVLIDQQQKLQVVSESRLQLIEDKVTEPDPVEVAEESEKKHWWQFFKRKG